MLKHTQPNRRLNIPSMQSDVEIHCSLLTEWTPIGSAGGKGVICAVSSLSLSPSRFLNISLCLSLLTPFVPVYFSCSLSLSLSFFLSLSLFFSLSLIHPPCTSRCLSMCGAGEKQHVYCVLFTLLTSLAHLIIEMPC